MTDVVVELANVSKLFGDVIAVQDCSFRVLRGETLALVGPSGCGKTTTLRMIAGLETLTAGTVYLHGQDAVTIPPWKRNIALVWQNYSLFPHLNVNGNVGFGMYVRGRHRRLVEEKVASLLHAIRLPGFGHRLPPELSGGEKQRVALARALIFEPDLLLLDEPLGALDRKLRKDMEYELKKMLREAGLATILVTHDQEQALMLADHIAVMNEGRIEQVGTVSEVFERPNSIFVARFLGNYNTYEGIIHAVLGDLSKVYTMSGLEFVAQFPGQVGQRVGVLIRPDLLVLSQGSAEGSNTFPARITEVRYSGWDVRYSLRLATGDDMLVKAVSQPGEVERFEVDQTVSVVAEPGAIRIVGSGRPGQIHEPDSSSVKAAGTPAEADSQLT